MLFNSLQFAVFLPVVIALFYLSTERYRWLLLLVASYAFYMAWRPEFALLLLFSTLVDYTAGLAMARSSRRAVRRAWLGVSLTGNLGLLFVFKYLTFLMEEANQAFDLMDLDLAITVPLIVLPVGISFYTFQTLSYTISVYRGEHEAEKHLGRFALYVSFFPQLVAGPIERSGHLLPQLARPFVFDHAQAVRGLRLILLGLFMKVVIADRLAVYVNQVYGDLPNHRGAAVLLATYAFSYQIYCDFAGYSYIAIGCGRLLGIELMQNFDRPYLSRSVSEFWKRWHISLSTWFRDYVYIPLGGNRVSVPRWYGNLLVTFIVSGIWHGANWTFVVWGALHGTYLIGEILVSRHLAMAPKGAGAAPWRRIVRTLVTFHLVLAGWVFFRSQNIREAMTVFRKIAFELDLSRQQGLTAGLDSGQFLATMGLWLLFVSCEWAVETKRLPRTSRVPRLYRWAAYYVAILGILVFGEFGYHSFIYFQF